MLARNEDQWQISNTKYNEGLQELQSFRDALKPVIDTYKGRWYHRSRVRKMNAALEAGRVEKHPRITDVEALEAFINTLNPNHPKSATELANAFESYLKTGFNWAKLSPLRKNLKAALLKFRSTHNLELIDTKLLFPHDEANPQVPADVALDLGPVNLTDSESPEEPSDNLLEAVQGAPVAMAAVPAQVLGNNNNPAPAAVPADARVQELTAAVAELNAQLAAAQIAQANAQAQAAHQEAIAADLGQQLAQRDLQIQQHQAEIVELDQRVGQAGAALNQAQTALAHKTAQVTELRAFAQAQEGLIAQQQVTIQQQKTLLEKLSEDFNTLTKKGFDLIRHYTNSLAEACGLFKKAVSKPKKGLFEKDVAQQFRDQARQQLKDKAGAVFESIENSGPRMQPLISDFIATKGEGNRTIDELDTVVFPVVAGRVLPACLQTEAEDTAEVAAAMAAHVEVNAPRVFPALNPAATVVAAPAQARAVVPGLLASAFAAPSPPPAPGFAPPPPPPAPAPGFNLPVTARKTKLSGHPDSLVNSLAANTTDVKNERAPRAPAPVSAQDELTAAVTGGKTLKKTDNLAKLDQKKPAENINALNQGFMAQVAANQAAKEAREARNAALDAQQAALVASLASIYAANHNDVDDWDDGNSLDM